MFDLTPIVEGIIAIVSTAITAFLIPWIKAKYGNETLEKVKSWVHIAVYAAEKFYGSGNGEKKLAYAKDFLRQHNIKVDTETLLMMIDAEIKKLETEEPLRIEIPLEGEKAAEDVNENAV